MMRTFIAVDMPEEVKEELINVQKKLRFGVFKLVKDFHITLHFLGEKTEEEIEDIKDVLSRIRFKSFDLELSDVGVFPSRKYITVIWVGTKGQGIYELQKLIDSQLSELNIEMNHNFLSHITIARVKSTERNELLKLLDNMSVKPIRFKVESFKLKKSTLTPEGPIYEDLGVYEL